MFKKSRSYIHFKISRLTWKKGILPSSFCGKRIGQKRLESLGAVTFSLQAKLGTSKLFRSWDKHELQTRDLWCHRSFRNFTVLRSRKTSFVIGSLLLRYPIFVGQASGPSAPVTSPDNYSDVRNWSIYELSYFIASNEFFNRFVLKNSKTKLQINSSGADSVHLSQMIYVANFVLEPAFAFCTKQIFLKYPLQCRARVAELHKRYDTFSRRWAY